MSNNFINGFLKRLAFVYAVPNNSYFDGFTSPEGELNANISQIWHHFGTLLYVYIFVTTCVDFHKKSYRLSPQIPKASKCSDSHAHSDPALLTGPDGHSGWSDLTGSAEAHLSGNFGDGPVPPQHDPAVSQPSRAHAPPEDPLTRPRCPCSPAPLPRPQQTRSPQTVWDYPGRSSGCSNCRKTLPGPA